MVCTSQRIFIRGYFSGRWFSSGSKFLSMLRNRSAGIQSSGLIRWSVQTHRINPSDSHHRMHRNDSTHVWKSLYYSDVHGAASSSRRRRYTSPRRKFRADFDLMVSTTIRSKSARGFIRGNGPEDRFQRIILSCVRGLSQPPDRRFTVTCRWVSEDW